MASYFVSHLLMEYAKINVHTCCFLTKFRCRMEAHKFVLVNLGRKFAGQKSVVDSFGQVSRLFLSASAHPRDCAGATSGHLRAHQVSSRGRKLFPYLLSRVRQWEAPRWRPKVAIWWRVSAQSSAQARRAPDEKSNGQLKGRKFALLSGGHSVALRLR